MFLSVCRKVTEVPGLPEPGCDGGVSCGTGASVIGVVSVTVALLFGSTCDLAVMVVTTTGSVTPGGMPIVTCTCRDS